MNDLDDLLNSALSEQSEAASIEAQRTKLRRLRTGPFGDKHEDEIAALRASITQFEEKMNWTSTGQVLLIERQICSCGAVHEWCQGEFLRQSHLRQATTQRLIPNNWPNCGLPRSIEYHDSSTHLCATCAKGWEKL